MSRLVAIAVAVCLLAPGDDVSAKRRKGRKGKVVRVERSAAKHRQAPRVLQVSSQTQFRGYGWAPEPGARFAIVDAMGVVARGHTLVVSEVAGTCQSQLYDIEYEVDDWLRPFNYSMRAVFGLELGDEARWLNPGYASPSGRSQDYVWNGIDVEGDGIEDLIVTTGPCEDAAPASSTGSVMMSYCMDAYTRKSSDSPWERATHDVWYQCR